MNLLVESWHNPLLESAKNLQKSNNKRETVANAQGATVTDDEFPVGECGQSESISTTESYSTKLVQHSKETPANPRKLQRAH